MQIACKCEICGHNYISDNDKDLCLEFDFMEKTISFVCRNEDCKHLNIMNFANWQQQQQHSALPRIGVMSGV